MADKIEKEARTLRLRKAICDAMKRTGEGYTGNIYAIPYGEFDLDAYMDLAVEYSENPVTENEDFDEFIEFLDRDPEEGLNTVRLELALITNASSDRFYSLPEKEQREILMKTSAMIATRLMEMIRDDDLGELDDIILSEWSTMDRLQLFSDLATRFVKAYSSINEYEENWENVIRKYAYKELSKVFEREN